MDHGHEVGFLNRTIARGSSDQLVCAIADINNAILVALDGDMKRIVQSYGIGKTGFLRLGLIKLSCSEPSASERVRAAMSLIEHEWNANHGKKGRRIFIERHTDFPLDALLLHGPKRTLDSEPAQVLCYRPQSSSVSRSA